MKSPYCVSVMGCLIPLKAIATPLRFHNRVRMTIDIKSFVTNGKRLYFSMSVICGRGVIPNIKVIFPLELLRVKIGTLLCNGHKFHIDLLYVNKVMNSIPLRKFDYILPEEFIAQRPLRKRDNAKLMVINRTKKTILHDRFYNIEKHLPENSTIVLTIAKCITLDC